MYDLRRRISMAPAEESPLLPAFVVPGGTGEIKINNRSIDNYFGLETLKMVCRQPSRSNRHRPQVRIVECTCFRRRFHRPGRRYPSRSSSRALLQADSDRVPRSSEEAAGFLTRDPRMKERKKSRSQSSSSRSAVQQAIIDCSDYIKMVQKPRKIKVFRGFTISKRADMV